MKRTIGLRVFANIMMTSLVMLALQASQLPAQQSVRIRVNRWLEVRQTSGDASYIRGSSGVQVKVGDRIQAVGDGIRTGANASVRLAVDTQVGFITVEEKTVMQIRAIQVAPDNGRITQLYVPQGQVRLQVRPFNHRGSRLDVATPSSISGVRGTNFGITVQPNGRTGLATLDGSVLSSAQGKSQMVRAGYQNLTMPGEAPLPPVPLRDDPSLTYRWQVVIENNIRKLRLIGEIDPVNLVYVDDVPQVTDRYGRFQVLVTPRSSPRYRVVVVTPLGRSQVYDLTY